MQNADGLMLSIASIFILLTQDRPMQYKHDIVIKIK